MAAVRNSTMMDVAREAGVSIATVSRVMNKQDAVRPETRERVERAMEKLGYAVNTQARSLKGGSTQIIGLLATYLSSEYVIEILRGIDRVLRENQYDLMLYNTYDQQNRESAYVTKFARHIVDGLLWVIPQRVPRYRELLLQQHVPHVLIDYPGDETDSPSIVATNFQGAYDAIAYLLQLGHRRIGFITGDMRVGSAQQRLEGYRAALRDFQMQEDPHLIYEGMFTQSHGYQGARALLTQPGPPTAIFASNDEIALGVMEAARECGLHLPGDLSIIGFDDIPLAQRVHPQLTTVRQPLEEIGRQATLLLLHYIAQPDAAIEHITLPTELMLRESCQAPHL